MHTTKVNVFTVGLDSFAKHFAKQEGKLRIWWVVLYQRKHYLSRHVSKFCYKQSTLLLSCCCILSNIHSFNSVERSSIACREEASDQVAIGFSFESDCLRQWCVFSGPDAERNIAKPKQSWITLDARSKIASSCS